MSSSERWELKRPSLSVLLTKYLLISVQIILRMSTDLISILRLDSDLPSKVITVKETKYCDSSFILSCIVSHSIKNKHAVIILSTHNSLMHYEQVGLKMNYSLQKQTEHMFNFDQKSEKYLFKLFDRGVKLFAPGTV
ncbi:unnamed protein product [Chilo suppressalis]|uniref:Elongator complex protein 6 n=1 Tax=Chilo suppressalis TaxID=168631 RepID=A0ABN8ATD2_CHISP|nr:hypothetical protein evm_010822 [Chilo suppressalis]CAH0397894.1 unnamed protein product [Chilo suppressalis]